MKPRRLRAAGTAALAALAIGVGPAAHASQPLAAQAQLAQTNSAQAVAGTLGADSGGVYLDKSGHAVVTVTNSQAAAQVTKAGMVARQVKYSYATLLQTKNEMDQIHGVTQTSWGIDPSTNKVVITILDSASPATVKTMTAAAAKYGDKVAIRHETGRYTLKIAGGDAIQNSQARCSVGFLVHQGGQSLILTAGHCTDLGGVWNGGDMTNGQVVAADVPGPDSGLITNNGSNASQINDGTPITSVATPTVGQSIRKSGSTTGITSGTVTSVDQTVPFDVGVLQHMTGTTVHSEPGDSGGAGYTGNAGQGTLSGGDSQTTFFYPLQREVAMYGISLNT
jgi:streptogrisin D